MALLERPVTPEGRGKVSYGLPSVLARMILTWSLAERGAFSQAVACGEEAVRLATAADHAESVLSASVGLGAALSRKGDIDRVIPTLERAVALGDAIQVPLLFPFFAMFLGAAYVLAGRPAEAIALLEKAWAQTVAMPFRSIQSPVAAHLGEAYLRTGRMGDAMDVVTQALELDDLDSSTVLAQPPHVAGVNDRHPLAACTRSDLTDRPPRSVRWPPLLPVAPRGGLRPTLGCSAGSAAKACVASGDATTRASRRKGPRRPRRR